MKKGNILEKALLEAELIMDKIVKHKPLSAERRNRIYHLLQYGICFDVLVKMAEKLK